MSEAGRRPLCRLGEGRGFTLGEGVDALEVVVVREGDRVYGYVNSCPHTGTPLEWVENEFMSEDGGHIRCQPDRVSAAPGVAQRLG